MAENKMGNISDKKLKKEIESGKRSYPFESLTKIEMKELVSLIKSHGFIAELNGTILTTNRKDIHDLYIEEYVVRKVRILAGILESNKKEKKGSPNKWKKRGGKKDNRFF